VMSLMPSLPNRKSGRALLRLRATDRRFELAALDAGRLVR
jgi:hypothetical protein